MHGWELEPPGQPAHQHGGCRTSSRLCEGQARCAASPCLSTPLLWRWATPLSLRFPRIDQLSSVWPVCTDRAAACSQREGRAESFPKVLCTGQSRVPALRSKGCLKSRDRQPSPWLQQAFYQSRAWGQLAMQVPALSPKPVHPRTGLAPCCRPCSRQERSLALSLAPGLLARSRRCPCNRASSNPPGEGWGANPAPPRCRRARLRQRRSSRGCDERYC